jgi:hypothetical protein
MTEPDREKPQASDLNPALKKSTETVYDTSSSEAPIDTTSAQEGEGNVWPVVWAVVTILGIALAVWLLV